MPQSLSSNAAASASRSALPPKSRSPESHSPESVEDILLRYSQRGMRELRAQLPEDFCRLAARRILSWPRGTVVLSTGFYVAGHAETDGPAGTMILSRVLRGLGFRPLILTDLFCRGYFEAEDLPIVYMPFDAGDDWCLSFLEKQRPSGLVAVERCGVNLRNDYANMRGLSIREHTAPCDRVFGLAMEHRLAPTVGIGDGGNEIGMGNLAPVIEKRLPLCPCRVRTDLLLIASVSNWGAYGLASCLSAAAGAELMPEYGALRKFLMRTAALGSVDGVTHENTIRVDGYAASVEQEIYEALRMRQQRAAACCAAPEADSL